MKHAYGFRVQIHRSDESIRSAVFEDDLVEWDRGNELIF